MPTWLRRAVPDAQSLAHKNAEDVAIAAGAAISALDAVMRRQERGVGVWRYRLALAAATVTVRQAGRVEDEAALRDAVMLTRPGDAVGPAGLMLLAWRRLAARPAENLLTERSLAAVLEEFGHVPDNAVIGDLADELRQLCVSAGVAERLTGAFMAAENQGLGRYLGCWLADVLMAQWLGWTHAVPLLGTEAVFGMSSCRSRRSTTTAPPLSRKEETDQTKSLLAVAARAALRAIDLSAELDVSFQEVVHSVPAGKAEVVKASVIPGGPNEHPQECPFDAMPSRGDGPRRC
ncbi:DUF1403 family protein [Mesorhizobium yinganensis]|uniref:DUF1403 family protein n=1 Tax=Mesorhizobium yinganensis TaxID=3157707 RepID=UPI0032B79C83